MQNLELKARCGDLHAAAGIAAEIGAELIWTHWQSDTYFQVPQGKLKLREVEDQPAELIAYQRRQGAEARISDYILYQVEDPALLKRILATSLTEELIVSKQRTLYQWHNVRIHLDQVQGLGTFIEFEAVLKRPEDAETSQELLQFLKTKFAIRKEELVPVGYYELLKQISE